MIPPVGVGQAATLEELQRYDFDKSGRLFDDKDGKELELYTLHNQKTPANAALLKYDLNNNGKLDKEELSRLYNDAEESRLKPKNIIKIGFLQDEAIRKNGIPLADLASKGASQSPDPCDPQDGLYIRRDRLDISVYNASLAKASAKGASVSYTEDRQNGVDTATIDGVASYVIARSPCRARPTGTGVNEAFVSGYAIAPWLSADGTLNNSKKESSELKFGLDAQFEVFSGKLFDLQYVTVSPYVQTDFRFDAEAYGASATWEPLKLDWRLGGSYQQFSSVVDFFGQLQLEADALTVNRTGKTSLNEDQEYAWLGGTARLNTFLLPGQLDDKLYAVGEASLFWDIISGRSIEQYVGEVGINISEDKSTSLSLNYTYGTNKSILKKENKFKINLNYKL